VLPSRKCGLMQNKTSTTKLNNYKENLPKITHDIEQLHQCKSDAMFDAIITLVLEHWRDSFNENEYAGHAEKEYLCESKQRWYVSASRVDHVTLSTNLLESHHGKIKESTDPILNLDMSSQAANVELPKLFGVHLRENNGVCICYPQGLDKMPSKLFHAMKLAKIHCLSSHQIKKRPVVERQRVGGTMNPTINHCKIVCFYNTYNFMLPDGDASSHSTR